MSGSRPSLLAGHSIELGSEHLVDEGERASLLSAAANARSIAMLTGTHGVVAMPLDRATIELPRPSAFVPPGASFEPRDGEGALAALVRARSVALGASSDVLARLRVRLELAHARLDDGDGDGALGEATTALAISEHAPSVRALLRTLLAGRERVSEQLVHVDDLAAHVEGAVARADYLTEKGRLLEAQGGPTPESAACYAEALGLVIDHPGALQGLEAALDAMGRWSELAAHFGRLAGLAGDRATSAWLHVERALLLDRRNRDVGSARAALDHALELEGGLGPVRQASLDHAVAHRDVARVADLLEGEAALEREPARATRLELDAALAVLRSGGPEARAVRLLERAFAHAPTTKLVDARVASELARLHEAAGRWPDALRVRKAALKTCVEPREELLALRAVASAAERAGALDDAILALERARVMDDDDPSLFSELDRLLLSAGRHDARSVLWMRESALADESARKVDALLVSAEALRAAGREPDAARQLQSAWVTLPGAPGVFDALAERMGSAASADVVGARVALYEQAAIATKDREKRLFYLEKIAWLWDDVAADFARAARAYEAVLAIDGKRASAIQGLASAAARAGDAARLARALLAEAAVTEDTDAQVTLRLRAAEAFAKVDPERSLVLAEALLEDPRVGRRAGELVTTLHIEASRWELVARSFADRASREAKPNARTALILSQASVLQARLASPERALSALDALRDEAAEDPAIARARIEALEAIGDEARLRAELERLSEGAAAPETRGARLIRAAELEEQREGGDREAVRLYLLAHDLLQNEAFVVERIGRLGARVEVPEELVSPLLRAVRSLDVEVPEASSAEPLLASQARDVATLRTAERLARRARSSPQLANALALGVQTSSGTMAKRALSGLVALVAWTLPESDDLEPWAQLLSLGTQDVVALDDLVRRARGRVQGGDPIAGQFSIEATKRRLAGVDSDTERLVFLLDLARFARRLGAVRDASVHARAALALEPTSMTAATLLAELAAELGDRSLAILAATALAELAVDPQARAKLLRDAADLSAAEGDGARAADLFERALEADPDNVLVAARLAQIQAARGAHADLARVLRRGVHAASTAAAIVPMASELADVARNQLRDPLLAIEALERSREVAPSHVPALFLLAELYIGQRAWNKSLVALGAVVERSSEPDEKLTALLGRASLFGRALGDAAAAETELRAALEIDPHDVRAIRVLLKIPGGIALEERAALLSRLVVAERSAPERQAALLELSDVRRSLGDVAGAEGALVEAAALSPDASMLNRLRTVAGADREMATRLLGRAVGRAREAGVLPGAVWLVTLGDLELGLGRVDEAIAHFEEALDADPSRDDARLALGRAFAAKGRHDTAAAALSPLLDSPNARVDGSFIRLLGDAFEGSGRTQQAIVASEVRALMGELDTQRLAALGSRRSSSYATNGEVLPASSLRSYVMPSQLGQHPIWDVAALSTGITGKLARIGLTEHGTSTKNRIKPRAVHPVRQLFDRVAGAFALVDVEMAISENIAAPAVAVEDVPWIVVPSQMIEWPEPRAIAALARPLVRVALGIPWFGALASHEVLAILVALARQVAPAFGATPPERVEPLVTEYELRVRRAVDRKRRRSLEDLAPVLDAASLVSEAAFADAVTRTEARAAFLLSGDLRASLDAVSVGDPGLADVLRVPGPAVLGGILGRPVTRDLLTFALGSDATALRHSLGTLWS